MSYGNRTRHTPQAVQKLLDENAQLIQAIVDYQNKGKAVECVQYQQLLHKNLVCLANLADGSLNIQAILPPPPVNQMPGTSPVSSSMGMPVGNLLSNPQDRKMTIPSSADQTSAGVPSIMQQARSSGSQIPSGVHGGSAVSTTGDMTSNVGPYGGASVSMGVQSIKTSNTPPVTGYPAGASQVAGSNMAPTSQSMLPGQPGYMPGMHPAQSSPMQPQSQQFMMQQNVPMGYNRPPVQQMHPSQQGHQPQQMNQPFMANQAVGGQQTQGMAPYQQSTSGYDPYNQMQHMSGYNNPFGPQ